MSMEKKRIRPVYNGNSLRISYSRQEEVLEIPDLIEVQKKSYEWFLKEGLKEAKDLVDAAPKMVKEGASKEEADDIKAKLEAEGAKVTLK